jgi:protein TonB
MPARWPGSVIAVQPLPRSTTTIVGSVVLFHVAALWALNAGLLRRAVEVIVPVAMLSDVVSPPTPDAQPPVPLPRPMPVERPVVRTMPAAPPPAPQPVAIADPAPSSTAPTGLVAPPAPAAPAESVAPAATPPAPAAPAKVELPSSDADYLQNPKPAYPPISRRLGEQGKVLVRVLIGADGTAQKVELRQSSGFDRLDQAALATAIRWRYVPGKRGGMPETMWFTVPMIFVLEQ